MRNCLLACFVLLLAGCGNDDKDGERTHDMVMGPEKYSVPATGNTVHVKTRYSDYIITSVELKLNDKLSSVMYYQYATLDSIFYIVERDNIESKKQYAIDDTIRYEQISMWREPGDEHMLTIMVEENFLKSSREYFISLDNISNYGNVYITQPSATKTQYKINERD